MKKLTFAVLVTIAITLSLVSGKSPLLLNDNVDINYPTLLDFESPIIEDEEYVDDIPFNTKEIFDTLTYQLEDEKYVDDIPFDTEEVVMQRR